MKTTILAIAVTLVLGAGCKHEVQTATYSTPQGSVTVKQDAVSGTTSVNGPDGHTTVTTKDGTMVGTTTDASGKTSTVSVGNKVDLAEFGMKPYPGATPKEGGSMRSDTPDGTSMAVTLETKDDADKILAFYKTEMKVETTMTTGDGGMVTGTTPNADKAVVIVSKGANGNTVQVTVVKKKKK